MKKIRIFCTGLASGLLFSGLVVGTYFAAKYVYSGDHLVNPNYQVFNSWGDEVFSNQKLTQSEIDEIIAEYKPSALDELTEVAQVYEKKFQETKKQYLDIKFWDGADGFPNDDEMKFHETIMTESYLEYRFFKFLNSSFVYTTFQEMNKGLDINSLPDKINSKNQYEGFLNLYQAIFNIVDSAASINNMFDSKQYDNLIKQADVSDQEMYHNRRDNLILLIDSLNTFKFREVIGNLLKLSQLLLEYSKDNNLNLNLATIEDEDALNSILETDKTQLKELDFDLPPMIELRDDDPKQVDIKEVNEEIQKVIVQRIKELNEFSWTKIENGEASDAIQTWGFKDHPLGLNQDYQILPVTLENLGENESDWKWNEHFAVELLAQESSKFCEGSIKINFELKIPTF